MQHFLDVFGAFLVLVLVVYQVYVRSTVSSRVQEEVRRRKVQLINAIGSFVDESKCGLSRFFTSVRLVGWLIGFLKSADHWSVGQSVGIICVRCESIVTVAVYICRLTKKKTFLFSFFNK